MPEALTVPSAEALRFHVLEALSRYWPRQQELVAALPVLERPLQAVSGPLTLAAIALPSWGSGCGVSGKILVPIEACASGDDWRRVDWWAAAFLLLECWHERLWEQQHGPIHSYSYRLKGWDKRAWQHAWVNRIGIFLRLWAAREQRADAAVLFGTLPRAEFLMTHDVDAIRKTLAIRTKQGLFTAFNAGKALVRGNPVVAGAKLRHAWRFFVHNEDWWKLDQLLDMEKRAGIWSVFHFYAESGKRTAKQWLFDPGYDLDQPQVRRFLKVLSDAGFAAGLHPGFDAWQSTHAIAAQRARLAAYTDSPVERCRQHWLRFSWHDTWRAQAEAGLKHDTTLMFNDRPGFRNSSALAWHPWDATNMRSYSLIAQPTVLMDSHLYDYCMMSAEAREQAIDGWLAEGRSVSGSAAVLWHPHTLTNDYGWSGGFTYLLRALARGSPCLA